MHKQILSLALAVAILVSMIPTISVAYADDVEGSGSVTGQVTVQASQPTVSFTLYSDSGYTTPTTKITPQTPVYMKISVSGKNPLMEYTITVKMFADNDNTRVGTPPTSTSPDTYVNFTISYDGNGWVLTTDTGGSTTWSIQLDSAQRQADPNATSGDFYVVITFGKTAREANTGDSAPYADWDIIVNATVAGQAFNTASGYGYTVYFYSEVIPGASTVDFGTLEAGGNSTIQQVDGSPSDHFTVTVIANGYYDLKATSSSTWNHTDGYTISLVAGSPGEGQFSLEADADGDFTSGAVYVTTDPATAQPFVDNAGPTGETGSTHNVYMLIILGTNIHTGTYQGTITIHAVDGG